MKPPEPVIGENTAVQRLKTEIADLFYEESIDTDNPMYRALDDATRKLTGMDAVLTAKAITALWRWSSLDDLKRAKVCLNYLIKRHSKGE